MATIQHHELVYTDDIPHLGPRCIGLDPFRGMTFQTTIETAELQQLMKETT